MTRDGRVGGGVELRRIGDELAYGGELFGECEADNKSVKERPVHGGGFEGAKGLFAEGDVVDDGRRVELCDKGGKRRTGFGGDFEQFSIVATGGDDHEIAEEFDEFGEDLFHASTTKAVLQEFIGAGDGGGGVSIGEGLDKRSDGGGGRFAKEVFEDFVGDMFFAQRQDAIENGEGITHRTIAEAGDAEEGVGIGFEVFILDDVREVLGDFRGRNILEIETLATRNDRRRNLVDISGGEDELHVRGRLFQRFEQRVKRASGEHVDFIDDVNFVR